jgi:hypothetical protein
MRTVGFAGVMAATVMATALPALSATRTTSLPTPFHVVDGANGSVSENVCSYATAPGVAHCNATRRIDAAALHDYPHASSPSHHSPVASPSVLGNGGAYDPSYLQSAYNVASLEAAHGGGAGQIVAVVDAYDDPNLASDLAFYRSHFGLSACPSGTVSAQNTGCVFEKINEGGVSSPLPAANASWGVESSLDVEMVSAICPNCQILIVEANTPAIYDLGTAVNTAVAFGATAVSNSYGSGEYFAEVQDSDSYYNHPGVDVTVSSGDNGYGVEFPAASPTVTAVGGTTLTQLTNTGTRNGSESVWSGAGAGCSFIEPKPSWQHDTGCTNRTVADVSADANPATGVWVYDTFGNSGFAIYGGTSAASPMIAALYALAGNAPTSSNVPASYLYGSPSSLVPVTSGSDGTCTSYLCNAALSQNGYNGPSGLGTPGASPDSYAAFSPPTGSANVPSSPTLTSAQGANGSVTLNWQAPSSAGGSAISGYNVYVGTSPGGESSTPVNSSPLSTTSDVVGSLTNTTTYYFTVKALNAQGLSSSSNELSATPQSPVTVPGAPTLNSAVAASGSVSLSWLAPSNNGGSAITGYNVYVGTSPGGESSTPVNSSPLNTTSDVVGSLTNSTKYYFSVKALNLEGSSVASNELSATPQSPITVPGAPSLTSAVAASGSVSLSWLAPSNNGGSAITGYNVYVGTSPGGESSTAKNASPVSGTNYKVSGLTNGTLYYFTVKALNVMGASIASNELSLRPGTLPSAVGSFSAKSDKKLGVDLNWRAPLSNGGNKITSYVIYRSTVSGAEVLYATVTCSTSSCSYVDTGTAHATTYFYQVAAVTIIGTGARSTQVSAVAR